jgi:hypothetical protein
MVAVSMASDFTSRRDLNKRRYSTVQKIQTSDDATNRMQYVQEKFVNENSTQQTSGSNTISDISVTALGVDVNHKLGRSYIGFNVIKNSSNANIYIDDSNEHKDLIIKLKSSSPTTITIMVF